MRTTIRIHPILLRTAKAEALRTRRTLTAVIEDSLRTTLAKRKETISDIPELPTFKGSGLCAGVDLEDSASLLEIMESP